MPEPQKPPSVEELDARNAVHILDALGREAISAEDALLLLQVWRHSPKGNTAGVWHPAARWAKLTGTSRSTVQRAQARLRDRGLIKVRHERDGKIVSELAARANLSTGLPFFRIQWPGFWAAMKRQADAPYITDTCGDSHLICTNQNTLHSLTLDSTPKYVTDNNTGNEHGSEHGNEHLCGELSSKDFHSAFTAQTRNAGLMKVKEHHVPVRLAEAVVRYADHCDVVLKLDDVHSIIVEVNNSRIQNGALALDDHDIVWACSVINFSPKISNPGGYLRQSLRKLLGDGHGAVSEISIDEKNNNLLKGLFKSKTDERRYLNAYPDDIIALKVKSLRKAQQQPNNAKDSLPSRRWGSERRSASR